MPKEPVTNEHLQTWNGLCKYIMTCDEDMCEALLRDELAGRQRKGFIRRIHCRMNWVRAERERKELGMDK